MIWGVSRQPGTKAKKEGRFRIGLGFGFRIRIRPSVKVRASI